ncbi:protein of unknown function [Taphrina deformans PYCC 5710]|uniref:Uncharacterized protein n=1 Tax=Taphrina deformans (strain PYCC 5710 / ATCC 11124 / CBS 356.35 / IMI 108563 / JCM 9778 / NBRC 8474) TaxID=1097556 RepID=R4XE62_TAPDE|nr:protein of unknown function [Taphrina deformans PYCC 5710]|eukprot:CCG81637.1 protein of unknown function [Taphrina deformans PYCC 5710]
MIDLVVTPKPTTGLSSKFSLRKTRKPATKQVAFSSPKFIEYEVFESEDDDNDNEDGAIQGARQSKEVEAVIARESVLKSDQRLGDREYNQEQDREKTESTHPQDPDVVRVGTAGARTNDSSSAERHLRHGEASLQAGAHLHKDSHSSFQSEAGSSVTTADDGEVKESKKKKGVFSGLFKKRSKREKSDPDSVSRITSATSQEERPAEESKDSGLNDHASHLTSETETHSSTIRTQPVDLDSGVLELPAAVKEMRSSVLMNTDPVTVDMVEEPHHRGPVDEVEMLLAHRNKTPVEIRDPEQQVVPKTETFVWTDRAIEAYLKNEKDVHKQLIVIVAQQAKSERLRNRPLDNLHVYGAVESSIDIED